MIRCFITQGFWRNGRDRRRPCGIFSAITLKFPSRWNNSRGDGIRSTGIRKRLCKGGLGESEQLGFGAVVGDEVWDQTARVRIKIGPLSLEQYQDFLPQGSAFASLRALTNFFSNGEFDFEIQLILDRRDVPPCELGAEGESAPQLGWHTYIKTRPMKVDASETILQLWEGNAYDAST